MSLGLGHNYLVRVLKHYYGDLDSCIKFMQENPPFNGYEWYELRPVVSVKKSERVVCYAYVADLLTDGNV